MGAGLGVGAVLQRGLPEWQGSQAEMIAYPQTRDAALARWAEFLELAPRYGAERNRVLPGHPFVSRLSGALRHRLVRESELIDSLLRRHRFDAVLKLVQELEWRGYWKSWLERRPSVWSDWCAARLVVRAQLDPGARRRLERLEAGECDVAVMNQFARELVTTGYLHNHARMWFASYWVHVERLPWELGAEFFLRHLLDGDAASNTLSWRWVAGLHTPGKRYFARRSNLVRYCDPVLLQDAAGLERLDDARIALLETTLPMPVVAHPPPGSVQAADRTGDLVASRRIGLWLHDEDGCLESSPLAALTPVAGLVDAGQSNAATFRYGEARVRFTAAALADAAARMERHFSARGPFAVEPGEAGQALARSLVEFARRHQLEVVVGMRPAVGPLADQLSTLKIALREAGIDLRLLRRADDTRFASAAGGGFFNYWSRVERVLRAGLTLDFSVESGDDGS